MDAEHDKLQQQIDSLKQWSNGKDAIQMGDIKALEKKLDVIQVSHENDMKDLQREMQALIVSVREGSAQSKAWYDLVNKDLNNLGEKVRENKSDIKYLKDKPSKWIDRGITASIAAGVSAVMAWVFGNLFSMK
jgi:hypothetical protein